MDISFVMRKLQRYVAGFTILALLSTFVTSVAFAQTFSDVDSGDWEYEYVENLVGQGVINGYEDGTFGSNDTLTRAQLAKIAVLAFLGEEAVDADYDAGFTDLRGDWSDEYINTAAQNGLVEGYSDADGNPTGKFGPSDQVNRAAAAQMLVNGAGLPEGDSEPFSDVDSGDWYYGAMKTAYWYQMLDGFSDGTVRPGAAVTRAQAAKMTVFAQEGEMRDPADVEVPSTGNGDLTVRVHSSSPDAMSVPKNGFEVPYTVWEFSAAGSASDVEVDAITVTRTGLGSPSNFTKVKLYVGSNPLGSEKTISSATNTATFNLSSEPLEVPSGSSVLVTVVGDMAGGSIEGAENALGIASVSDIDADGTVAGSFPVRGDTMRLANVSSGTLSYTHTDVTGDLEVGDTDETLGRLQIDAGSEEDVYVERIRYKQTGSANGSEDLANLMLYNGSTVVAELDEWDGDYAIFEFDPVISLGQGDDINLVLRGDIAGGIGNTIGFEVREEKDIVAYGSVLGFRTNNTESASFTPTSRSITGGVLNFSRSSSNPPTQEMGIGADDWEFLRFNVTTAGDAVLITDSRVVLDPTDDGGLPTASASDITDIKIRELNADGTYGSVVAGPVDGTTTTDSVDQNIDFTDDWEVPAGTTKVYVVTGDLTSSADAGDTYAMDFDIDNLLAAEYVSSGDSLTASDITPAADLEGNVQTVAAPTLTIVRRASPQDQEIVKNAQDVDLVAFTVRANTVSDLEITSFKLSLNSSDDSGDYLDVSNVALYLDEDGVRTRITSEKSLTNATVDNVTFSSIDLMVAAGETVEIVAVGDIPSGATTDAIFSLGVAASSDITAQDDEGSTSNVSITTNGVSTFTVADANAADAAGDYEVTVKANGTLSAALDGDTPSAKIVPTGQTGANRVHVGTLEFTADREAFDVEKFQIKTSVSTMADEVQSFTVVYEDENDAEVVSTATIDGNGIANFTNQSFYVPKNGEADMMVYASTLSEANGADSGATLTVRFDFDTEFEAFGEDSGTRVTSAGSANVDFNSHTVYAADLLVAVSDDTPTSSDVTDGAGQELFKFDLTADGENTPSLMAVALTISGTVDLYTATTSATNSATLEDEDGDVEATEAAVTGTGGAGVQLAGTHNTTTLQAATGAFDGIPLGASLFVYDADGTTMYEVTATALADTGTATITTSTMGFTPANGDDVFYIPMQPGAGKLYFGGATTLAEDIADAASDAKDVASGNGFALGDDVTARGTLSTGVVVACTASDITGVAATTITDDAWTCSGGTIDFDYSSAQPPAIYTELIDEEVTDTETFTLVGDVTGASPSSTGVRTLQVSINSGSDISWNDDWPDVGDDVDDNDENTRFIIQSSLLNVEKDGYDNFSLQGSALSFET